jgi:hypothetical protein
MVFPVSAGFPSQSGIMIPEIWSPKVLVKFYSQTFLTEISNTD